MGTQINLNVTLLSCSWIVEPGYHATWNQIENLTRVFREPPCDCCGLECEEVRSTSGLDFNVKGTVPNDDA